jgi:DNA polymerase (family 10)
MADERIPLELAEQRANEFVEQIRDGCERFEICGSIRRRKPLIRDIDVVLIPKPAVFWPKMAQFNAKTKGEKLVQIIYQGMQIDLYMATPETFETLRLIRTGSSYHNKLLCMKAQARGWHLHANGKGLVDSEGKVIADTEDGILQALLGKVPHPTERF